MIPSVSNSPTVIEGDDAAIDDAFAHAERMIEIRRGGTTTPAPVGRPFHPKSTTAKPDYTFPRPFSA